MAIYARTQTTETTTQTMTPMASQEIGNVIVKSLENVVDTLQDEKINTEAMEKYEKERFEIWKDYFEELKKDKNNPFSPNNVNGLLVAKGNNTIQDKDSKMMSLLEKSSRESQEQTRTNKSMNMLLTKSEKDKRTRQNRTDREKNAGKEKSNKTAEVLGKVLKGVGIASLALGVIKGNTDMMQQGAKKILTIVGSGVVIGSQLWVLAKGAIARFRANWPVVKNGIMAEIKAWFENIPARIELMGLKLLSKIRINGKPIFGTMTREDKAEYSRLLEKKDSLSQFVQNETSEEIRQKMQQQGLGYYDENNQWISTFDANNQKQVEQVKKLYVDQAMGVGTGYYGWNSSHKAHFKDQGEGKNDKGEDLDDVFTAMGYSLSEQKELQALIDKKEKDLTDKERRLLNVLALKYEEYTFDRDYIWSDKDQADLENLESIRSYEKSPDQYFKEQEQKLQDEQERKKMRAVTDSLSDMMKSGTITEYQFNEFGRRYGIDTNALLSEWKDRTNEDFVFADATNAEKFLTNEYKAWQDSWEKMFQDLAKDIGITTTVKQERNTSNPTIPSASY